MCGQKEKIPYFALVGARFLIFVEKFSVLQSTVQSTVQSVRQFVIMKSSLGIGIVSATLLQEKHFRACESAFCFI